MHLNSICSLDLYYCKINKIGNNFGQIKYDLKYSDCYGIYAHQL